MSKIDQKLREIKKNKYTLLFCDDKYIDYMDRDGYKYHKAINGYSKELTESNKYGIKNIYWLDNIDLMLSNGGSKTKIIKESFTGSENKARFVCGECGREFEAFVSNMQKYKYKVCAECVHKIQNTKKLETEDIRKELKRLGFELVGEYENYHKRITVINSQGYKGKVKLDTLRNGGGISNFASYNPYALDNLILYSKKNGYNCTIPNQKYKGYDNELKIKCSCGKIFITTANHFIHDKKIRCNSCVLKLSNLEETVKEWLNNNNIIHKDQYVFQECRYKKPLPFDFYLPDSNVLIEVQGEQHYRPVSVFGGEKSFRLQQKKDKIKKNYCDYNNIKLLLISYKDIKDGSYKEILEQNLLI